MLRVKQKSVHWEVWTGFEMIVLGKRVTLVSYRMSLQTLGDVRAYRKKNPGWQIIEVRSTGSIEHGGVMYSKRKLWTDSRKRAASSRSKGRREAR